MSSSSKKTARALKILDTLKSVDSVIENIKNKLINIEKEIDELNLNYDRIIYTKKIPRDPRHNSKIDYNKLIEILNNK